MTVPTLPALPGLAFPYQRALSWPMIDQTALSGKRSRSTNYSYPVLKYVAIFSVLRADNVLLEQQTLEAFINSLSGGVGLFQVTDPLLNAVTAEGFGTTDGVTTTYQLVAASGGFAFPVFMPTGTPQIFVGGTLQVGGYTIGTSASGAPGSVIFSSAPAASQALTWTGTYNIPVRFDDEEYSFEHFGGTLWRMKALKFSSEKLP